MSHHYVNVELLTHVRRNWPVGRTMDNQVATRWSMTHLERMHATIYFQDPFCSSLTCTGCERQHAMCVRCCTTRVQFMLLLCRHACYCEGCAITGRVCPICNNTIIGTIRFLVQFSMRTHIFRQFVNKHC